MAKWHFTRIGKGDGDAIVEEEDIELCEGDKLVGVIFAEDNKDLARAKLIVRAPELLEENKKLKAEIKKLKDGFSGLGVVEEIVDRIYRLEKTGGKLGRKNKE